MPSCPSCNHSVSFSASHCPDCAGFLGSPRDLVSLGLGAGAVLGVVGLLLMSNIVFPNLALSRSIEGVKRGDPVGMEKLRTGMERREVAITGTPGLGWEAEKFGDIALVSFNYLSLVDENPKRYAAWWVFEPGDGKTKVIQNAQEFIDGFLLRRGLTAVFPDGVPDPKRIGASPR